MEIQSAQKFQALSIARLIMQAMNYDVASILSVLTTLSMILSV